MDIFQLLDELHDAARKLGNRPVPVRIDGNPIDGVRVNSEARTISIEFTDPNDDLEDQLEDANEQIAQLSARITELEAKQ